MKCQSLFSGKRYEKYSKMSLAEFLIEHAIKVLKFKFSLVKK